jgi:hypothetical protein
MSEWASVTQAERDRAAAMQANHVLLHMSRADPEQLMRCTPENLLALVLRNAFWAERTCYIQAAIMNGVDPPEVRTESDEEELIARWQDAYREALAKRSAAPPVADPEG